MQNISEQKTYTITPISALNDNYIWVISNHSDAWVVDPGDATAVMRHLVEHGLTLVGIILTHHHHDHAGGIGELLAFSGEIPVIASHRSTVPFVTRHMQDGDAVMCLGLTLKALSIPGHTLDHMAFYSNGEVLFSGDTLFSAGCGRVFEGTMEMMYESLCRLAALDDQTKLYCGHEYSLANLRFAVLVEPENRALLDRLVQVESLRQRGICTLPTSLGQEKAFNPFLRCEAPDVVLAAEKHTGRQLLAAEGVFAVLREWKNSI